MHININLNTGNIPLSVAQKLVSEFSKENPNVIVDGFIIDLSKQILNSCENTTQNKNGMNGIDISLNAFPIAMRTWASTKHVFNIEFAKTEGIDQKKVSAVKPYTYTNTDWSDVEVVTIAKEGVRGAWFFSNAERGSVVVKGQEDADKQVMGTVFLRIIGINTPDAKLVAANSLEGKQISSLGHSSGLNNRSPSHYIVMDRVLGPSYTNLTPKDVDMVKKNLELIGQLAVYDLVLGNFDRFQLDTTSFNSGNIMFQDNVMHAIDTDCIFDEEREGFTKLALKKLIENRSDLPEKIARKLGTFLGDGVNPDHFSTDKIAQGAKIAITNLLNMTKDLEINKTRYVEECAQRGVPNIKFPLHVEKNLQYMLVCNKNFTGK